MFNIYLRVEKKKRLNCYLSECSVSSAMTMASVGGGSMKAKPSRSLMPMAFSCSTVAARLVRWISGTLVGSISSLLAEGRLVQDL